MTKQNKEFTSKEIKALKELAKEKTFINEITDNTKHNKKVAKESTKESKHICDFWGDGKCNSNYGNNMKCDGIHTPDKCPYKNGGSYAMAVYDQGNRRKSNE